MNIPQVEGLTALAGPANVRMTGSKFSLPPSFDSTKFASKWEEQGPRVIEAQQPQVLAFANCSADGWQVFKVLKVGTGEPADPAEAKPGDLEQKRLPQMVPYTRAVGKAVYILMYRPKALQEAVNVLYANQSREIVGREVMGESAAANQSGDPGILTNEDLRKFGKDFSDEMPTGYLPKAVPSARKPAEAVELQLAPG
jgi:hypothetical protein